MDYFIYISISFSKDVDKINRVKKDIILRIQLSKTTDHNNNTHTYHRIISLIPSNTEILYRLGLGKNIIGVSTVDDYPKT